MRNAYLDALYDLATDNKQILALVADNGAIVYDKFRRDFPSQFINFGISEANMVSVAAGMASCGKIPFVYTISCFIAYRAFEQVRNDVCLQKMNVKLVGIGVGFVYSNLGPTHHATEDISLMRSLPNMTIFSPADRMESYKITIAAAEIDGPVYIRLATGGSPDVYDSDYNFSPGRAVILQDGDELTIITTGSITYEVKKAVCKMSDLGISVRLVNMHTLKPIDKDIILESAEKTRAILTVEEHTIFGGLGCAVAEVLAEANLSSVRFKRMGLDNHFPVGYGNYQDIKEMNGLSKEDIIAEAKALLE